jgi:hypothetical protein
MNNPTLSMERYYQPSQHTITMLLPVLYGFARYGRRWKMSLDDARLLGQLYTELTGKQVTPLEMAQRIGWDK